MIDFIRGFLLELGFVMTVGLQSAFILKQGIRREYVITAVLTCFAGETLLVSIGIGGMGALINSIPSLYQIVTFIGILFLVFYAGRSFYAAVKRNDYIVIDDKSSKSSTWKEVFVSGLGFALLNPHVVIDTTMMGTIAANFYPRQWIFGAGVISAAFFWYVFLGTVGATFAKPLNNPKTWKVINVLIGLLCLFMAFQFAKNISNPQHEHNYINFFSIFGMDDSILEDIHDHEHEGVDEHNHSEPHNHNEHHSHDELDNHNEQHIHDESHINEKEHNHNDIHNHDESSNILNMDLLPYHFKAV